MEFLKKNILAFVLLTTISVTAQNQALLDAFKESYSLEKEGKYKQAIDKLKSVYKENSYETNLRLGWLSYYAGFFTESLAFYQKAINLMPYSIEARLGYVNPQAALGNWNIVINTYEDILEIDPMNYTANYRLASIYYGRKEYASAYKYYQKIANSYPFDYDATLMFAWTNYMLGKKREANILFNKVLLISPNDSSALEGIKLTK